jgi:hypothetical protein
MAETAHVNQSRALPPVHERTMTKCTICFLQLVDTMKLLGLSRFEVKYSKGTMPHDKLMASIELYGTKVVPMSGSGSPDCHHAGRRAAGLRATAC